ncbi:hypothetical protein PROFUN_03194 [Planoprotostelium fungivorum]|uniref:Uncharacterized protein n=1 Tax=Planoprotostelium fungivorum TaxID=1890364 RepID=A0A2P6NWZ6_9EUKA|nr:hypothetical protein PROFUN_03194 [Planoprotostelium fungivorum]
MKDRTTALSGTQRSSHSTQHSQDREPFPLSEQSWWTVSYQCYLKLLVHLNFKDERDTPPAGKTSSVSQHPCMYTIQEIDSSRVSAQPCRRMSAIKKGGVINKEPTEEANPGAAPKLNDEFEDPTLLLIRSPFDRMKEHVLQMQQEKTKTYKNIPTPEYLKQQ